LSKTGSAKSKGGAANLQAVAAFGSATSDDSVMATATTHHADRIRDTSRYSGNGAQSFPDGRQGWCPQMGDASAPVWGDAQATEVAERVGVGGGPATVTIMQNYTYSRDELFIPLA
jgi:hypothetical protein